MSLTAVKPVVIQLNEASFREPLKAASELIRHKDGQAFILTDALPDMVWTLDLDFKITYTSHSITDILGCSFERAAQLPLRTLYSSASAEKLIKSLEEKLNDSFISPCADEPVTIELELMAKDGSSVWTETKVRLTRDNENSPTGFVGLSRDITERRRQERQANHRKLLSLAAEMTEGIAREINNPLGGILLSAEQMLLSSVSPALKKDLEVIHREAKRAAKMMSVLLNAANMTPRKMERSHLSRLINKVLEIRKFSHKSHNIKILTNLCKPGAFINCDIEQIQRVFMSIIMNAEESVRKQSGGSIILTSRKQGRWVKAIVAHDGMPESIDDYFSPSERFLITGNESYSDLTYGQCQSIITYHGGIISAERNKMGGTSYIIELPLA